MKYCVHGKAMALMAIVMLTVTGCLTTGRLPKGYITADALARQLGMQVVEDSPAGIALRNKQSDLLIRSDTGQVFLDASLIAESVPVWVTGGATCVPESLVEGLQKYVAQRPLSGRIVIDAGHGGKDPGAVSVFGVYEKDVVLFTAREVYHLLSARGVHVILTRDTDTFVSLDGRARISNDTKADLFISIHADSAPNKQARGFTAYIAKSEGSHVSAHSQAIADRIIHALSNGSPLNSRGVRKADYRVLKTTRCPAVLVELGYLSNKDDARLLQETAFLKRLAACIASGIADYLTASSAGR